MRASAAPTIVLTLAWITTTAAQEAPPALVAPTDARTPEQERAAFRLPPGFEAQLVASEPDIAKPMNLAFDARGRLWVTSSYEYPYPAPRDRPARDKVTILEDFGSDGRARKVTTFADGLNIPIGVLPLSTREALVYSIPNIYHMIDDDGDGRADRREVAYATFGFQDTHGMASAFTFGFDGWIYACHGFANTSKVAGRDGQAVTMNSGNTYRIKADGSHLEQLTWGQVNPFGLAFDARGNLYSCDCHSRPIYQLLRGAYYPSFGKPDDGLGFGPEMMTHDHGSTGIGGITVYEADAFPDAWRGTIFIGNVVTSRINHDRLEWTGSSPKAVAQPDFLISDDPWFRPVDIELGPDGALYVADFYNKIIGHYEVPLTHPGRDRERGRIWRIVYNGDGAQPTPAPRGGRFEGADAGALADDLAHPNLAVRLMATKELVGRGADAIEPARAVLAKPANPVAAAHALWALHRLGELDDAALTAAVHDPEPIVRVHALRVLAEMGELDDARRALVLDGLRDSDALARRCAAEALGRHPASSNLRPLLDARHAADARDTHLVHVIRMALRDQLRADSAFDAIGRDDWSEADLRALADVANGVPSLASARFLLGHLEHFEVARPDQLRFEQHVARFGDAETDARLVRYARAQQPENQGRQAAQLRAIHQGLLERGAAFDGAARAWAVAVVESILKDGDPGERAHAAELAGALRLSESRGLLETLAVTPGQHEPARAAALAALLAIEPGAAVDTLGRVAADADAPITLREHCASLLGQAGRPEARARLLEVLPSAPARLQPALAAALASNREGAEQLLAAVAAGKASARLLQDRSVEVRLRAVGVPDLDARLADLTGGLPPADEAIAALIRGRQAGFAASPDHDDARRGAEVFTKHCAACHQIGGRGERVGPQLDGIGARGADRLMEDILDPNRNVDQAFRATTLALDDGRVLTGLVLREEGDVVVVADAQGKPQSIPKASIEERRVAPLSPMPADLAAQIEEADFYALIAYLREQKAPAETR
jgi:putative heme-binding domain-containing protein